MRKCRQKDLTGCNQSVVGTAPNSSLNSMIIKYYSYDIAFRIFSMKYFQKINKVICCMFIAYKRNSLPCKKINCR